MGDSMKYILAAVALMLFAIPARAEVNTSDGNYLLGSCQIVIRNVDNPDNHQDKYEAWRDGYCRGIVRGVSAASSLICPQDGVTSGQEIRVVLKFLQDHPEKLNMD